MPGPLKLKIKDSHQEGKVTGTSHINSHHIQSRNWELDYYSEPVSPSGWAPSWLPSPLGPSLAFGRQHILPEWICSGKTWASPSSRLPVWKGSDSQRSWSSHAALESSLLTQEHRFLLGGRNKRWVLPRLTEKPGSAIWRKKCIFILYAIQL